jgi:REP element-mobilizing transposase RayT
MYIPLNQGRRKSHIDHGDIYFWTATINKWYRLLEGDEYKDVIIDSLQYLSDAGKIDVFAFIIMPNHIHLTCLPAGRSGESMNPTEKNRHKVHYLNTLHTFLNKC